MITEKGSELIRVGNYLAEVSVERQYGDSPETGWAPSMSIEDIRKIERVRKALENGDIKAALFDADIFELRPL